MFKITYGYQGESPKVAHYETLDKAKRAAAEVFAATGIVVGIELEG